MRNPFFNDETEAYRIEDIYEWFVSDDSTLSKLYKPKHHFICGDRGTGKSMLMRYLEPYCQFKANGGWENFLKREDAFIAFYIPIPKNLINISVFQSTNLPVPEAIFAHYFNMLMTEAIIKTMQTQLKDIFINENVKKTFAQEFVNLLNPLPESIICVDEICNKEEYPLEWILKFVDNEKCRIMHFINYFSLRKIEYTGSLSDYHSFVLPFVKLIKRLYSFDKSIYLLIDDAGNIFEFQQKTFNSWIANRNHEDLSIKLSTVTSYYKTFLTITGEFIDGKNDFQYIHLDKYDSKSETASSEELKKIIDKRLIESGIKFDSNTFFETDPKQNKVIDEARLNARQIAESNERIVDKDRYTNRYTMREFYKIIESRKPNKRTSICRKYCGINDIINFSSFNIRDCLKTCSLIFDEAYPSAEKLKPTEIKPVNVAIQNKIMQKISKSEFLGISLFKEHYDSDRIIELKQLITLLATLFRSNLLNYDYAECGVTAFQTSMDHLSNEEREVIRIGVEQRYLLRRFYPDKKGTSINTAYALNKMFFPHFKLELTPFSGRIWIPPDLLKKMLGSVEDFENFIKNKKILDNCKQLSFFESFDLENEMEDELDDAKNNLSELF